ncbi:hypothetical protein C4J87_2361 [Pseudomonas sp. R1-43-08]|nr:hypothetical protein C4J87_2361 [Pseudomonas sp. R1-43-08]
MNVVTYDDNKQTSRPAPYGQRQHVRSKNLLLCCAHAVLQARKKLQYATSVNLYILWQGAM